MKHIKVKQRLLSRIKIYVTVKEPTWKRYLEY